jgi:hypothetical protein
MAVRRVCSEPVSECPDREKNAGESPGTGHHFLVTAACLAPPGLGYASSAGSIYDVKGTAPALRASRVSS